MYQGSHLFIYCLLVPGHRNLPVNTRPVFRIVEAYYFERLPRKSGRGPRLRSSCRTPRPSSQPPGLRSIHFSELPLTCAFCTIVQICLAVGLSGQQYRREDVHDESPEWRYCLPSPPNPRSRLRIGVPEVPWKCAKQADPESVGPFFAQLHLCALITHIIIRHSNLRQIPLVIVRHRWAGLGLVWQKKYGKSVGLLPDAYLGKNLKDYQRLDSDVGSTCNRALCCYLCRGGHGAVVGVLDAQEVVVVAAHVLMMLLGQKRKCPLGERRHLSRRLAAQSLETLADHLWHWLATPGRVFDVGGGDLTCTGIWWELYARSASRCAFSGIKPSRQRLARRRLPVAPTFPPGTPSCGVGYHSLGGRESREGGVAFGMAIFGPHE